MELNICKASSKEKGGESPNSTVPSQTVVGPHVEEPSGAPDGNQRSAETVESSQAITETVRESLPEPPSPDAQPRDLLAIASDPPFDLMFLRSLILHQASL